METTLPCHCPGCGRALTRVPLYTEATVVVYRTCRGCRRRWQVKAKPTRLAKARAWAHFLDFVEKQR